MSGVQFDSPDVIGIECCVLWLALIGAWALLKRARRPRKNIRRARTFIRVERRSENAMGFRACQPQEKP